MADEGTSWTSIVYLGIAILGFFVIKSTPLSQSEYRQVSLYNWKPLTKEEKLVLGITG